MVNQHLEDYREWIGALDKYYGIITLSLFSPKPKNKFLACCSNFNILYSVFISGLFLLLKTTETTASNVAFQQLWPMLYALQTIARGINRIYLCEDMDQLIQWYECLYQRSYLEEYQNIIDKQLELQNKHIKKMFRFAKC